MNRKRYLAFILLAVTMLLLAGCNRPDPTPTPEPAEKAEQIENQIDLIGSHWEAEYMGETDAPLPVLPDTKLTLNMMVERYAGYGGCNWFLGVYDIDGAALRYATPATTPFYCEDEALVMQEGTYMSSLANITEYEMEGEKLVGYTVNDQRMLTFIPTEPMPLEGTEWKAKIVYDVDDEKPAPISTEIQISALFEGGVVSGSAGCNDYTADYTIDGEALAITNITTDTNYDCAEPGGVMSFEGWYLSALEATTGFTELATSLTLHDETGRVVVLFGFP